MTPIHTSTPVGRRTVLKWALGGSAAAVLGSCSRGSRSGSDTLVLESVWSNADPRRKAELQIVDLFTQKTGIKVKVKVVPFEGNDRALLRKVASRQAPDITQQFDVNLQELVDQGALEPLDQYVRGWTSAQKADYITPWSDMVFDGRLYAVRYSTQPGNALIYHKNLYREAGFATPPRTFDEWDEASRKVTTGKRYGLSLPFSSASDFTRPTALFTSMMWALGGDLTKADGTKPTFHDEPGVRAAQWLQDRIWVDQTMPKSCATTDENPLDSQFVAGLLASTVANSSNAPEYQAAGAPDTALAPFPNFANTASVPGAAFNADGWTLAVPKHGNTDLAWRFLEFYQTPEAQLINIKVGKQLPTHRSVLVDPYFNTPEAAGAVEVLKWIEANPHPAPLHVRNLPDLSVALGGAFQKIITERANVKSALESAAHQYTAALA